ncbi:MAG: OmpA family protein [Candidatus Kapabacteria bacterium]|nr:OmpA family protein [Candidatus Kapabacteria bacterium]
MNTTHTCTRIAILLALFAILSAETLAQPVIDNLRHRFGVSAAVVFNIHSPDFKQLPNVPNCCPQFESGSGTGYAVGALYEHPLTKLISLGIRATLMDQRASLLASERTKMFSTILNAPVDKSFEHRIDTRLTTIGIEPMMNINPAGGLRFHAGMRLAYMSDIQYSQRESIIEDGYVFLDNQLRTRNELSGTLSATNALQTAVLLGASIEFPLNRVRTVMLAPELFYHIGVSNLAPDISWRANAIRLGIALKFADPPVPAGNTPLIPLPPVTAPDKPLATVATPAATVPAATPAQPAPEPLPVLTLRAVAVDEQDNETPLRSIRIEEVISTEHKPLLTYVFFDERSSELPPRYTLLRPDQHAFFTERSATASPDVLDIYHHVLNIIGRRMLNAPLATLTLTGCTDGTASESSAPQLARRRAETVKKYLTSVWRIPAQRISVDVRAVPQNPSRSQGGDTLLSHAENRRVEITSTDDAITAPVTVRDTVQNISPKRVRFYPVLSPVRPLASWDLRTAKDGESIARGGATLGERIEHDIRMTMLTNSNEFTPTLTATLASTDNVLSAEKRYRIERIPLEQRLRESRTDIARENYGLIIFDFGKSELNANHKRIVSMVRRRAAEADAVRIEGFTDEIGDAQFNTQLAFERATAVANDLGIENATVHAAGESSRISNTTPEGRFYNRTVSITIEHK